MQFNSIEFLLFLPIVYLIYWYMLRSSVRWQNVFVIAASYVFYGWWNWRLLGLIVFSSFLGWGGGLLTERVDRKMAKWLVGLNVAINLGILAVFKYYNFFAENLAALGESLGVCMNISTLNLLLPVGISFYTFQTLSYVIDVYRGRSRQRVMWLPFLHTSVSSRSWWRVLLSVLPICCHSSCRRGSLIMRSRLMAFARSSGVCARRWLLLITVR